SLQIPRLTLPRALLDSSYRLRSWTYRRRVEQICCHDLQTVDPMECWTKRPRRSGSDAYPAGLRRQPRVLRGEWVT
ncbi:hypothetical protein K443DRAFT_100902, partial [Laccaria amethystina LaAM-08-1]